MSASLRRCLTGSQRRSFDFGIPHPHPFQQKVTVTESAGEVSQVERLNMTSPADFLAGNYRFIPGVFQYSAGVAAALGYEIRRVRFREPVPLVQGFERLGACIAAAGRPLTALCACELRSPAPFTEDGFRAFNESYVTTLARWGLFDGRVNPVARSNVCPEIDPPGEPSFHAFAFTAAAAQATPSFVIAGSGEAPEGRGNYADHIVRRGETGADAMAEKARFVLAEMERRLGL